MDKSVSAVVHVKLLCDLEKEENMSRKVAKLEQELGVSPKIKSNWLFEYFSFELG